MNKILTYKDIRFSPEIEVEFPENIYTEEIIDNEDRDYTISGWKMTSDGSLENGIEYKPCSYNKLYYNETSLNQIKRLLNKIQYMEGRIKESCGLHIHIDAKDLNNQELANIISNFVKQQDKIIDKFEVNYDRLDQYCHRLPSKVVEITKEDISTLREYDRCEVWEETEKKYYALNIEQLYYGNYNTLEFRLFNGTLDFNTMSKYIRWTLKFIERYKMLDNFLKTEKIVKI
jgi:hypothetical protein